MMKRVLLAGMKQESNSFVPGLTDLDDFRHRSLVEGKAIFSAARGPGAEIDGMIQVADEEGIELIPIVDAAAMSGPPVADTAHADIRGRILAGVQEHRSRLDGVVLALHGAMLTESLEDPEGELLSAVRAIVGPNVPIAASFDLHCHMTDEMARSADIVVGYHTCPHVDFVDTGRRTMRALAKALRGEARPVVAHRKFRMMASSENHDTNQPPMVEVMGRLLDLEQAPGILAATIFATQPWLDVADLGWSVVVVADGDRALGQVRADEVASMAWARRQQYLVAKTPIKEAVQAALAARAHPIVMSDAADSPTGGGCGDGNFLLRALLEMGYRDTALITITDPEVAARCFEVGVGGVVSAPVGGKLNRTFYEPVPVSGRVKTLTDGRYLSKYPPSPMNIGRTAVLEIGGISLVVSERPAPMLDREVYRSVGLDPLSARIVQVKSAGSFRAFYEPIAASIFVLDTPGPCGSDLTKLPFRRIRRPLWPFDPDLDQPW